MNRSSFLRRSPLFFNGYLFSALLCFGLVSVNAQIKPKPVKPVPITTQRDTAAPLTAAKAVARIRDLIGRIQTSYDERNSELGDGPYFKHCKDRMQIIFDSAAVPKEAEYVDFWGSVCTSWADTSKFYWRHINYLTDSIDDLASSHRIREDDIAYLEHGVDAWFKREADLSRLINERWNHLKTSGEYQSTWRKAGAETRSLVSPSDATRKSYEAREKAAYERDKDYYGVIHKDNADISAYGDVVVFEALHNRKLAFTLKEVRFTPDPDVVLANIKAAQAKIIKNDADIGEAKTRIVKLREQTEPLSQKVDEITEKRNAIWTQLADATAKWNGERENAFPELVAKIKEVQDRLIAIETKRAAGCSRMPSYPLTDQCQDLDKQHTENYEKLAKLRREREEKIRDTIYSATTNSSMLTLLREKDEIFVEYQKAVVAQTDAVNQIEAAVHAHHELITNSKPLWNELEKLLLPYLKEMFVYSDDHEIYSIRWEPNDEITDIDKNLEKLEPIIGDSGKRKDEFYKIFKNEENHARYALELLAGTSNGSNNSIIPCARDLATNTGVIVGNARIGFCMDLGIETFEAYEAGSDAGIAQNQARLLELARKAGLIKFGTSVVEPAGSAIDESKMSQEELDQAEREMYSFVPKKQLSPGDLFVAVINRALDTSTAVPTNIYASEVISGTIARLAKYTGISNAQAQKFQTFATKSAKLEPRALLKEFGIDLVKDVFVTATKNFIDQREVRLWEEYFLRESTARAAYANYAFSKRTFETAMELRDNLLAARLERLTAIKPWAKYDLDPAVSLKPGLPVRIVLVPQQIDLLSTANLSGIRPTKSSPHEYTFVLPTDDLPSNDLILEILRSGLLLRNPR